MTSLPHAVQAGLRAHALALKAERSRGHLPLRAWAGRPAAEPEEGTVVGFDSRSEPLDRHDLTEVALAMANAVTVRVDSPMLWLTRSGAPDLCPADLTWLAAMRSAWAELGLAPSFAVVTREGWVHHPSGTERRWRRLRA